MGLRMIAPKRVRKVRTKNGQEVLRRLEEYLQNNCDEPAQILCGFWEDQQNAITYQELRQAVKEGAISQETLRLWRQDYSVLVTNRLSNMWPDAIMAGPSGQPILDGLAFEFNTQTPGILNWLRERGAEFVTSCTTEQKDAIAALLTKKMRDSHTVDELSRLIRPCIGLTESDAKAAARYYDNIVFNLKKEHPRMKMESIRSKALDATQKYAERKHRERAMTIAQTESAFAYNRGADEGVRQAQEQGYLGKTEKRWNTSGDDGVCETCSSLEGVEIGMDANFNIGGRLLFVGQHMLPPAHPRCACAIEYIEVEPPVGLKYEADETEHEKPSYIGSLENTSDDMVKSVLEEYESEIVNSDIENAVVVTKSGLIWQCYGNKTNVYPDIDLGIELNGACVTHNHPKGPLNEYSFSDSDIKLFQDYNLRLLRGIDDLYIYELDRNSSYVDELKSIYDLTEYDGRHEYVIKVAKQLGVGYRRRRR